MVDISTIYVIRVYISSILLSHRLSCHEMNHEWTASSLCYSAHAWQILSNA